MLNGGYASGPLYGHWQKKAAVRRGLLGELFPPLSGTSTEGAILDR